MSRDPYSLPDRWLHCPKIGSVVQDLFVPFKTPLSESFRNNIAKDSLRWEPSDVISLCQARKIPLGVVIDLTNASRYYKGDEFSRNNVEYRKIACRGHGESPDSEATEEFISFCSKYHTKNPHKRIGVHCTHGFNRTGFLISAYLVTILNCDINAAVAIFQKARKPGIYKQDYLDDLQRLYGDPEDDEKMLASDRPSWEEDENGGSSKSKQFMEGIPGVTYLGNCDESDVVQKQAQRLCQYKRFGFPGSQPVSMDIDNYKNLANEPHFVSWKADGTRYMMIILGKDRVYFLDRDNAVFKVEGMIFPKRKDLEMHLEATLLDGEMVIDDDIDNDKKIPRYLIYDIIHFEGDKIGKMNFDLRMFCILREIYETRNKAHQMGIIDQQSEPFRVRRKEFWPVQQTAKILGEKFQKDMSHEIDGLIFQPCHREYMPGRCDLILKWKPPHLNTIDFRLKIGMTGGEGIVAKKQGLLFVGSGKKTQCIGSLKKVDKVAAKLDGKIVECKLVGRHWEILRERTDKSFPNSYETAQGVMRSITEPVTKELLLNFIECHAVQYESEFEKRDAPKRPAEFARPHPPKRPHY